MEALKKSILNFLAVAKSEKEKPRNLLIRDTLLGIIYSPQEIELKFKYPNFPDDDKIKSESGFLQEEEGGFAARDNFLDFRNVDNSLAPVIKKEFGQKERGGIRSVTGDHLFSKYSLKKYESIVDDWEISKVLLNSEKVSIYPTYIQEAKTSPTPFHSISNSV